MIRTLWLITLPLPPLTLSKNGSHGHWSTQQKAFQSAKADAVYTIRDLLNKNGAQSPWTGPVLVGFHWFAYGGKMPDLDNMIGRIAAYLDAAQTAGLYVDDQQVKLIAPLSLGYDRQNPRLELVLSLLTDDGWREALAAIVRHSGVSVA